MNTSVSLCAALLLLLLLARATPSVAFSGRHLRVIGGSIADKKDKKNEYGSYVLISKGDEICGGTLIGKKRNLVITAAHCVVDPDTNKAIDPKSMTVSKGPDLKLKDDDTLVAENAQGTARVKKIFPHPKYGTYSDPNDIFDDIAILLLNTTLPGPVATLAKPGASEKLPDGTNMTVVGFGFNNFYPLQPFGKKGFQPYFSPTLYKLTLSLGQISKQPCDFDGLDNKKQLCLIGNKTSFPFPNEDGELEKTVGFESSCRGDSGGPLYYGGAQYGLVSYGHGLCTEFKVQESVFTKISSYRKSFIDPIVKRYS